ncbi:hypothetical protein [Mycolicibacterium mucogenicum]|jgi:hypothetical protein|uniref:hypothetical protein n=1 Tax=Mycolicibacterium mucogenicum TaxID=56689 RepID=UPI000769E60D|nr:hypothetical protein [Mycolicibacterium mucogenicum]
MMTAYRYVTITCDLCGEICDPGMAKTVRAARAAARAEGWKHVSGQDHCPRHYGYYSSEVSGWLYDPVLSKQQAAFSGWPTFV